jgi:hypothetical protein
MGVGRPWLDCPSILAGEVPKAYALEGFVAQTRFDGELPFEFVALAPHEGRQVCRWQFG